MSFFQVDKNMQPNVNGIVYILIMELEDKKLIKVGVTTRLKIEMRITEILSSIFISYRIFPYCKPKKFKRTTDIYKKEADLHYHFDKCRYETGSRFSGSTEMFEIDDIDYVCEIYERCLAGEDIRKLEQYENKISKD